jgi:putative DNA primase/helicase
MSAASRSEVEASPPEEAASRATLLQAALAYAAAGLSVVPLHAVRFEGGKPVCSCSKGAECTSAGKHPRMSQWGHQASSEAQIIQGWWGRWPNANIGLALGQGQRLIALDVDGAAGWRSLEELEQAHGELPPTKRSRSGSGVGGHLLFRIPEHLDIPGNRQKMLPGIDVRGRGGQIVVAPSLHLSGNRYAWEEDSEIAAIPSWLYDLITRADERREREEAAAAAASRPREVLRVDDERAGRYALAALTLEAKAVAETPPGGGGGQSGRDTRLFQAAVCLGELIGGGLLTESMVREELLSAALACGLKDPARSLRQIQRGIARGRLSPRGAPEPSPSPRKAPAAGSLLTQLGHLRAEAPLTPAPVFLPPAPALPCPAEGHEEAAPLEPVASAPLEGSGGAGGGEEDEGDDDGGPLGASWPDSDEGLAARLLRRRGEHLRYVPRLGWLVYEGGRWNVEGPDGVRVRRWALESASLLRAEVEEARPWGGVDEVTPGERALWKARAAFARSAENAGKLASAVSVAELFEEVAAEADDLNRDDMLLCCKSGVIDLRTGQQAPHDPLGLHTAQSSASFNPKATCPAWEKFLLEIMGGDADMVAFLRRAVGYTLTGRLDEQCFFLLHGDGSNGKSVFTHILQLLLGTYGNTAQFTTFAEQKDPSKPRPDLARLLGARFVTAAEPSASLRLDEGVVKQITGGDRITARFLHQNDFEFSPKFKLWLSTNILPKIRGADHGIWRRVRLIPFNVQFRIKDDDPPEWPQADPGLKDRLVAELPGIFAWAIQGCLDWQQGGLRPPAQVLQATDAYRTESDNVLVFLQERCRLHADYRTPTTTLFDAYIQWCEESGIDHRLTSKSFGKRLSRVPGLTAAKWGGGVRGWLGLRLLTEAELHQGDDEDAEDDEDEVFF